MGIKRSTLYYQPKININKKQKELRIRKKIEDISRGHPYYSYRRITTQLRRKKVIVNHKKVSKIMKELVIQALYMAIKQRKPSLGFTPAFKPGAINMLATATRHYWAKEVSYVR